MKRRLVGVVIAHNASLGVRARERVQIMVKVSVVGLEFMLHVRLGIFWGRLALGVKF